MEICTRILRPDADVAARIDVKRIRSRRLIDHQSGIVSCSESPRKGGRRRGTVRIVIPARGESRDRELCVWRARPHPHPSLRVNHKCRGGGGEGGGGDSEQVGGGVGVAGKVEAESCRASLLNGKLGGGGGGGDSEQVGGGVGVAGKGRSRELSRFLAQRKAWRRGLWCRCRRCL